VANIVNLRSSGSTHGKANGKMAACPKPRALVEKRKRGQKDAHAAQLEKLLDALRAARAGDFGVRLEIVQADPLLAEIARAFNGLAARNEAVAKDALRLERVISAVAEGDLTQKMPLEVEGEPVKGEFVRIGTTVNAMVDQLRSFASEMTRLAKEVGTEGKLGGQAEVKGASGTWKDLTDNFNVLARNLTDQVRNIATVTTAVANGDLSQKMTVSVRGELLELKNTINTMVDQLNSFASEVTRVAKEVGAEGKLGGQAMVPGARGTWRRLTDNVNQLAANLTEQVRAISDVATSVTKGDLTRSIDVQAMGEVAALKDNINQMIVNLRETTQKNMEQDWLKTNLARFSSMMQGQKDLQAVSDLIMSELTPLVSAHYGAFFMMETEGGAPVLVLTSSYAYSERKAVPNRFRLRQGLVGQCAYERKAILVTKVPNDYVHISSGLGEAPPLNIIVLPILFEGQVKAVIELASFHAFSPIHQLFLNQLMESIGVVLNVIIANMRTEELLQQSQGLAQELQSQSRELTAQQEELKRSNLALGKQALELEEKARQLALQNAKVEEQNREVEQARIAVEEKAAQLALISRYKSEFLANMSHELRTPLNSLLILARLLADNPQQNLNEKQVEYARTIYASGVDLLALINEILDLSKVESGKMRIEPRKLSLAEVGDYVQRNFQPVADQKGLALEIEISPDVSSIRTDPQRLQQILKNLLSNAFKFTESGGVTLYIGLPDPSTRFRSPSLERSERVIAFAVADTGIGIPQDKHQIIFEAFQQVDGTTNRRYGGTGLGLSISREIARLLGGEIHVESVIGKGSRFTLYLPQQHAIEAPPPEDAPAPPVPVLPPPPTTPAPSSHALPGTRVLVVDDDVRNIFAVSSVLEEQNLDVVYAENGKAALQALEDEPGIDVILMDVMMPEMDGYETIEAIRARPQYASLPIIAVTAKALKEDRDRCLAVGASDYLPKPVDMDRLLQVIGAWALRQPEGAS
jgi:signal transduction histidine kinase/HAMP domain-containing protein/ActR/RegA family two-component response regulator